MAECVASPFCGKLRLQRRPVRQRGFSYQPTNFKAFHRKHSRNRSQLGHFSVQKTFDLRLNGAKDFEISSHIRATFSECIGVGALAGATASDLVPVVDQTFLVGKGKHVKDVKVELLSSFFISVQKNYQLESKYALNVVRGKLMNSLNALEHEAYSGDIILPPAKRTLSLNAVAEGPKLRLLWAAFQKVEEEIKSISSIRSVGMDVPFKFCSEFIQRSCHSICATWLENEFSLLKGNADKEFASVILEKVKGDNLIVQSITRSGKKDLYSELLWYLTFGSLREDCCYDSYIFGLHGISILEDLVIALADGVASVYLEFISVDSDISSKTNSLHMSFCALSTRELQKLRNEVALNQWLCHNMDAVVSMYEDRFDLCTLESQPVDLPDSSWTEKQSWWERFTQLYSNTVSSEIHCIVIGHFSLPVKRTKELRALTGWRYYFSLFLELSDITMPLIRAVTDKVSSAISFFLVTLIGRSLGLIYTGIRQSLRWK